MTSQPSVRVSQVPVTGNTAKVPARDIYINGKSLHALLVSTSHGLQPNQIHATIDTTKINHSWYVTGFEV
jgi:hypothetical protein